MFIIIMVFEDKMIDTVALAKIALVILPLMLIGNLLLKLKEWWKKGIGHVFGQDRERAFRNEQSQYYIVSYNSNEKTNE